MRTNDFLNELSKKIKGLLDISQAAPAPSTTEKEQQLLTGISQLVIQKAQEIANKKIMDADLPTNNNLALMDNTYLSEQCNQQRSLIDQLQSLIDQQQSLIARLQIMEKEHEFLMNARMNNKRELVYLKSQVSQLEYQSNQLKETNTQLRTHNATLAQENKSLRRQIHSANNSNNENRQPQPGTETTTVGLFNKKSINTEAPKNTAPESSTQTATNFFR